MALIQGSNHVAIRLKVILVWLLLIAPSHASSEVKVQEEIQLKLPKSLLTKDMENKQDAIDLLQSIDFQRQVFELAKKVDKAQVTDLSEQEAVSLSSILGQHEKTKQLIAAQRYPMNFYHHSLYAEAQQQALSLKTSLTEQIKSRFSQSVSKVSDETLHKTSSALGWSLSMGQDYMLALFRRYQQNDGLSLKQAINLISNYQLYKVYEAVLPLTLPLLELEQNKRYLIDTDVLVKTPDGATISAIVVRKRGDNRKRPTAFQFTIYADEVWEIKQGMHAAAHGYVGVVAKTRGKAKSPDEIVPWEHDGKDAHAVIDWISKQSWSDGRVAMYGGSYLGFTQWAAAKYMHPALKTIVPYEAAHPFVGLPVENNIFITPNYQWAFHVTNNKTMDHSVYNDWEHWQNTYNTLFESGRAFKDIDKVEGTPNPWFQKWLRHSSYDKFYQAMLPYQEDYKKIDIPVLSVTGYFGASISAMYFFNEHYRNNPNANHTMLIGPYNHRTAQGIPQSHHSNYKLDKVALEKDTQELTFQWFDHVFYDQPKPKLVKGKFNYQLMGSNTWQHSASLSVLNQKSVTYQLGNKTSREGHYTLTTETQKAEDYLSMTVDMADRTTQHNANEWRVIKNELSEPNGLVFITKPFTRPHELSGSVTGYFNLAINKKDVDIGFKLYELKNNGETFKLTRYISRASYAQDMSKRELLTPGKKTMIPITNSTVTAKLIERGSRLVMVLNVNKNTGAQVNMGTGKDVSEETISDAGKPLEIKWFSDSHIKIPLKAWLE